MSGQASSLRQAYRDAAHHFHAVKVSETAHVHVMEDGAFVEIQVWIPKEALDSTPQDKDVTP